MTRKHLPPSGRPLTRDEKNALAVRLMHQAGNLIEFFDEMVADEEGTFAQVSAQDAAWQLSRWLRHLPGTDWDTRLPYPEV